MSTEPTSPPVSVPKKIDFAPLHRTVELENIHAQVVENDPQPQQQQQQQSTRKILVKHMTVIGDGSDI
ncbi:unnamed protein product [Rotaria sp. Silwood1]|nr:unnamed protein product [Rotaria sp. Silwood1]CAF1614394.1 unnamed protein product [Rotaria sp. Silwood1]CAF3834179.1 unnamed protein product [Rotaria sp. Silwood1]CAF4946116.1 unnamed protein product [Rotaria sp. Silwood1]